MSLEAISVFDLLAFVFLLNFWMQVGLVSESTAIAAVTVCLKLDISQNIFRYFELYSEWWPDFPKLEALRRQETESPSLLTLVAINHSTTCILAEFTRIAWHRTHLFGTCQTMLSKSGFSHGTVGSSHRIAGRSTLMSRLCKIHQFA